MDATTSNPSTTSPAPAITQSAFAQQIRSLLVSNQAPFYSGEYVGHQLSSDVPLTGVQVMKMLADEKFMNNVDTSSPTPSSLLSGQSQVTNYGSSTTVGGESVWKVLKDMTIVSPLTSSSDGSIKTDSKGNKIMDDGSVGIYIELDPDTLQPVTVGFNQFTVENVALKKEEEGQMLQMALSLDWFGWGKKKSGVTVAKKTWYPSTTGISIHAFWWGFELYFPHPVLQRLNPSIQKDIAIIQQIATVLSFAISHLPSFIPISPTALLILKGLAPVIGYIASFMGWARNGIESKDQGKGIILSATWLCPVALVPRSWDAPDPPKDSTTSQPPVTSTPTKPPTQPVAAPPTPPATPADKADPPKVAFPSSPSRAPATPSSVGVNGERLQQLDTGGESPSRTPRRISLKSPLSPRTKARIFKWRKEKGDVAPDQPVL